MTSPLPPRLRDTRNLIDRVRQDRQNLKQLGGGMVGGRFAPAKPLGATAQMGDIEDDDAGDNDLPAAQNLDQITATSAGQVTLNLSYAPIDGTLLVFWDGIYLHPSEYVLAGQAVTFTDRHVHVGHRLEAVYWYWPSDVPEVDLPPDSTWWAKMNETSNVGGMIDYSGNGRTSIPGYSGVGYSAPSLRTDGADSAITFNGSISHADLGYEPWMDTIKSGFVLFKTSGTGLQAIISRYFYSTGELWTLGLNGGALEFRKGNFFSPTASLSTGALSLNNGSRHGAAFAADGTNLHLWVDGTLRATTATGALGTGSPGLTLGGVRAGGGGSYLNMFNGTLDEPMLFDVGLTDSDASQLWAAS